MLSSVAGRCLGPSRCDRSFGMLLLLMPITWPCTILGSRASESKRDSRYECKPWPLGYRAGRAAALLQITSQI